jgi:hypothetical protein
MPPDARTIIGLTARIDEAAAYALGEWVSGSES